MSKTTHTLSLEDAHARMGKIANNLEQHGDEEVTAFAIPLTLMLGAELGRSDIAAGVPANARLRDMALCTARSDYSIRWQLLTEPMPKHLAEILSRTLRAHGLSDNLQPWLEKR